MKTIPGMDNALQLLGTFHFSEFRIVRKLCFWSEQLQLDEGLDQKVDLVIESEDRNPNYRMEIACSGVTALTLKDFGGGETRVTGFEFADISERQWEDVIWEISDFENDSLRILCRSLKIVSVHPIS
jgi:hypothetical protein